MGRAAFEEDAPFLDQEFRAAAVLCRTEHGNLHAGLLYRVRGRAAALHLGWQDQLHDDWRWSRLWAAPNVEPERLNSVASMANRIWRRFQASRQFPYAIKFAGTTFDRDGRLVLGKGATGLTCATFILAVFKSMGIDLIDEGDWPVRTEDARAFLASLKRWTTQQHFAVLSQEVDAGCTRIRPDEVLGACTSTPPAAFAPTRIAADRITAMLE